MTNIVVPELGESVVEARVARWLKKEGDRVEIGEPIVELETEKIDLEVNADRGGVIATITRKEGEDVKIGEVLGVVDESPAPAASRSAMPAAAPTASGSTTPAVPAPEPSPAAAATSPSTVPGDTRRSTLQRTSVRRQRHTHGEGSQVNLGALQGRGRRHASERGSAGK